MRIAFDLVTPKQVPFFMPMITRLRARGCSVALTSRDWSELNVMMRRLRRPSTLLGKHGGRSLQRKLLCSGERVGLLARHFARTRPDVLVTLGSPESARAAFGLQIPIVCFMDLPESRAVCRLTLPLASKVCAPWIIPRQEFLRYGVAARALFFYRALDPVLWLKDHPVDTLYLRKLGLDPSRPIVVCRETEWQSAYAGRDIVGEVAAVLRRRHPDWQIVNIPRYRAHPDYDIPSLVANAQLLIGGGGTMCIEAAYYGTPVIATRLAPSRYMEWLFERRLAVKSVSVAGTVRHAEQLMAAKRTAAAKKHRAAARRVFGRMTFPLDDVIELILRTGHGA
jgi:predicted glycosyltransferase